MPTYMFFDLSLVYIASMVAEYSLHLINTTADPRSRTQGNEITIRDNELHRKMLKKSKKTKQVYIWACRNTYG